MALLPDVPFGFSRIQDTSRNQDIHSQDVCQSQRMIPFNNRGGMPVFHNRATFQDTSRNQDIKMPVFHNRATFQGTHHNPSQSSSPTPTQTLTLNLTLTLSLLIGGLPDVPEFSPRGVQSTHLSSVHRALTHHRSPTHEQGAYDDTTLVHRALTQGAYPHGTKKHFDPTYYTPMGQFDHHMRVGDRFGGDRFCGDRYVAPYGYHVESISSPVDVYPTTSTQVCLA